MAWRAVIADDEEKILSLIRMLGHWDDFDIEIIDECTDGRKTLESILANKPDFVISDIKMPELDGIQLIEETKKAGIDCLFILVSGYRHFEYARSAISLNAMDYLLKPISEEQLNEALKKTCMMLKEKQMLVKEKDEYQKLKEQQEKTRQDVFWQALIHPENGSEYEEHFISRDMLNRTYNFEFRHDCWQIVFLTTSMYQMICFENSMLEDEISRRFLQYLTRSGMMYYLKNHFGYNIILNFDRGDAATVRENISALFYSVRDLREIYGDFTLHIGVSEIHESSSELKDAFVEARAAEWGRFTVRFDSVLFYSQIASMKKRSSSAVISTETVEAVCSCMKYLRISELSAVFEQISRSFQELDDIHPQTVSEAYFRLIDAVTETVPAEKREAFSERIDNAFIISESYRELIRNTFAALNQYIEEETAGAQKKNRKPISEAVYYISRHYAEQISQTDVAEACNVSPAYMSRLFKEEMGIGFQDYLTKIRLEQAEKMLKETNMTVKEIALAIGYPDEKYFSKVYKKQTGIKPSDYRKIYG